MSNSIKDFVMSSRKKDMINSILRKSFSDVSEEEYEELTNLVFNKIDAMNEFREFLRTNADDELSKVAEEYTVDEDAVLDSFVYFVLILENVYLRNQLSKIED